MRKPFKGLLWKEAHESSLHAGWTAVLFSILVLLGIPGLRRLSTDMSPPWELESYHIIAAIVALGFGFAQTNRETREMWSFALHRPVSGARIFTAKLVVGVSALLLAIGVPYVACLWWLSMPGVRTAPFDRAYWLPAIVSLCAMITWYVAGLYAGARQRGFTSRLIGLPVAFLASTIASDVPNFWAALLTIIAVTAVLAVATCSEFLSGSDFESQHRVGRSAVVTSATYAVAAVFAVAATSFGWLPMEHSPVAPKPPTEGVAVTHDGSIVKVSASDQPDRRRVFVSRPMATDARAIPSMAKLPYNDPGRWVARLYPGATGFVMYYERRTGLISVYDDATGVFRGWIGPNWSSDGKTMRSERFAGYLQMNPLHGGMPFGPMVLSGGYYDLDPLHRRARLVFAPPAGEELLAVGQAVEAGTRSPGVPEPWGNFLVATTDKRIYAVDEQGVVRFSSAYTGGDRGRAVRIIRFGEPSSRRTLLWYAEAGDTLNHVVEVADNGAPVKSFKVAGALIAGGPEFSSGGGAWTRPPVLAPLRVMPAFEAVYAAFHIRSSAERVRVAMLICLVSAAFTWLLCRRYGFAGRRAAAWTALAAVTGPIAPAVMLLLLEWPAKEALAARSGPGPSPAWSAT